MNTNRIKYITQAFLGILIISTLLNCKNSEGSDDFLKASKADPIISGIDLPESDNNEKKENVNEEGVTLLSDSDSLSDASTAFALKEDGKYNYKLRLTKGKNYKLYTQTVSNNTQSFRGKSATENSTTIENVDFKVLQSQNGQYKMSATFTSSRMTVSGGGKSVTVDATKPKPSNPMLQGGWMIQKARKGKTITFQMDEEGNVSNVKGFEAIHAEIKKLLQTEVSGEELNQLYSMITRQINGETFKMQIEQGLVRFPKGGAKIGETWTEQSSSGSGSLSFTLQKVENGKAYIGITSNYPPLKDSQSEGGITGTISETRKSEGTMVLDLESGWVDNGKMTDTMTRKESYTDGKETQSTSLKSVNTTTINQ